LSAGRRVQKLIEARKIGLVERAGMFGKHHSCSRSIAGKVKGFGVVAAVRVDTVAYSYFLCVAAVS
jgi:hypothetical protein